MLGITGVSEIKYAKYGEEFINLIIQNSGQTRTVINVDEQLTDTKIAEYIKLLEPTGTLVSPHTIGKILIGSERAFVDAKIKMLPFYGLLYK